MWFVDVVKIGNVVILLNCNVEYVFYGENFDGNKGRKVQGVVVIIGDGVSWIFVKVKVIVVVCGVLMILVFFF